MGGRTLGTLLGWRRHLRRAALALLLPLLAPLPALAGHEPGHAPPLVVLRPLPLGDKAWGFLAVPRAAHGQDRPAAILLLGDGESALDGRNELYAQRLLSLGFALLDADFDGLLADEGTPAHPTVEPLGQRLGLAISALDRVAPIGLGPLAAIGIGVGARAVLEGWAEHGSRLRAAVLLYPVCDADLVARAPALRAQPGQGRILLVHGDADAAEVAKCGALVRALGGPDHGVARYVLQGAAMGWDMDGGVLQSRSQIPDPAQPARRREAQPDHDRAAVALDRILIFLMGALEPRCVVGGPIQTCGAGSPTVIGLPQLSSSESQ